MTNRTSSNINIPEAREAMDKFKMEAASDVGVPKHETKNNQLPTQKGLPQHDAPKSSEAALYPERDRRLSELLRQAAFYILRCVSGRCGCVPCAGKPECLFYPVAAA